MKIYSEETLKLAFYKYVKLVNFEDEVFFGWFVPDIRCPKSYFILNKEYGGIYVFLRSHIKSITYVNNNYTLRKDDR